MRATKLWVTLAATTVVAIAVSGCSGGAGSSPSSDETAAPASEVDETLRELVPQSILDSGTLRVGGSLDYPPVAFVDLAAGQEPVGVAPDLLAEAAAILGLEPQWSNTTFPGQLPGLESGNLDIIMGQISSTEEREQQVLDLIPFIQWPISLLVPAGNPLDFSDFESMCGHVGATDVGGIHGRTMASINEKYCIPQGLPPIDIKEFNGGDETAVRSGAADFAPQKEGVNKALEKAEPDIFENVPLPKDQGFEFDKGIHAIGVSKSNPGLSEALAGALTKLVENGRYEEILEANGAADGFPQVPIRVNALTDTPAGEMVTP